MEVTVHQIVRDLAGTLPSDLARFVTCSPSSETSFGAWKSRTDAGHPLKCPGCAQPIPGRPRRGATQYRSVKPQSCSLACAPLRLEEASLGPAVLGPGVGRTVDPHVPVDVGRRGHRRLRADRATVPPPGCSVDDLLLHRDGSARGGLLDGEDVLGLLSHGSSWTLGEDPIVLPSKSAIFQAGPRLGPEPLEVLFSKNPRGPLGDEADTWRVLWWPTGGGHRLGRCLDVADTPENDAHFGRPGVNKGEQAAFPQARVVAAAECATHAIFDACVGEVRDAREHTRS